MKNKKNVTINQHYVPQFYLLNFSYLIKKEKPCIDVLDIDTGKHFYKQKIQKIASENYFYDIDLEKYLQNASKLRKHFISIYLKFKFGFHFRLTSFRDLNIVENILADLESKTSPIITKIIYKSNSYTPWEMKNCFLINEDEKRLLSMYFAMQFLRTPKTRHTVEEANIYLLPTIYKEFHYRKTGENIELKDLIEEINKEEIKQKHLEYFFNEKSNHIADVFNKHSWVFYKNTTDVDFITSDSPISTKATRDESLMSFSGINSKGVMIIFPISKKLILVMYENELNQTVNNKKLLVYDNPKLIEAWNLVIFLNAHRFVYGEDKELKKLDEYVEIHKKSTERKMILVNSMIPKDNES